jgi:hypothetical protein
MTDPTPNNIPVPTPLSPAAQAVMDAWVENTQYAPIDNEPLSLAAALRAVADQVASHIPDDCTADVFNRQLDIRAKILAIATELEGYG